MRDQSLMSPHVVVGASVGAGRRQVDDAYARALKRLRSNPTAPFTREDLGSASYELTSQAAGEAFSFRHIRVPVVPSAYEGPAPQGDKGLAAPRNLPRRTTPLSDDALQKMAQEALDIAADGLLREFDEKISATRVESMLPNPAPASIAEREPPSLRALAIAIVITVIMLVATFAAWHWPPPDDGGTRDLNSSTTANSLGDPRPPTDVPPGADLR